MSLSRQPSFSAEMVSPKGSNIPSFSIVSAEVLKIYVVKLLSQTILHISINTGLAKKFLRLLSKHKGHIFHFLQELYWTTCSPFCSTTFCHFSGNFIIPPSQNFLSFWAKNYSRCLLQSSKELTFFPLRQFYKEINGNPKVQCLVNTVDETELSSQAVTVFPWSSKKHVVLCYPDGKLCVFCWLIQGAFRRVLLSVGLIGSSICWMELIIWFSGRSSS